MTTSEKYVATQSKRCLMRGPQTKKSNLTNFPSDYCSMLVVSKYF